MQRPHGDYNNQDGANVVEMRRKRYGKPEKRRKKSGGNRTTTATGWKKDAHYNHVALTANRANLGYYGSSFAPARIFILQGSGPKGDNVL